MSKTGFSLSFSRLEPRFAWILWPGAGKFRILPELRIGKKILLGLIERVSPVGVLRPAGPADSTVPADI
jgi:hypothetical protein